jgi:hypothetical protein
MLLKSRLEEEQEIKMRMSELKKALTFIDKTNWFFERDTFDFSAGSPLDQDQQYAPSSSMMSGLKGSGHNQAFTIGGAAGGYHHKK